MVLLKKWKTFLVVLAMNYFFLQYSSAATPGTSIFSFLKINPSAQLSGMGDIDCNINAQSALINPAMLPWVKIRELSLQHLVYLGDTGYSQIAYNWPIGVDTSLNASFGYFGYGNLTRTIADSSAQGYTESGNFSASDQLLTIGYGHRLLTEFSFGIGAKVVRESIDGQDTLGILCSLAAFYYPLGDLYRPMKEEWQIGFGLNNIGARIKGYAVPTEAFFSIGKHMNPSVFFGAELVGYIDQSSELRTGIEYNITDVIGARVGYKHSFKAQDLGDFPQVDLSAGFGITFQHFIFNYAWVPYGDLGMTHRVSIAMPFGKRQPEEYSRVFP